MWSTKSTFQHTYYSFSANIEIPTDRLVKPVQFKIDTFFLYDTVESPSQMEILFYTVLLVHCLVYIIKIFFEMSLSIAKFANMCEIANMACMLMAVVTKYIEVAIKHNHVQEMTDDTEFHDFSLFISIESMNSFSLTFCSMFLPFRIYQFMAHYPTFDPASTILNTIWRILPGMIWYLILSLIVLLTWSIGFYISLGPYFSEF